ncbi:hypothetical protein ABZZ20_19415 [Streptomyces sp. NPDC006430]|uniref:hypothetical protein n=1 Tax=Streptomyces sp. NPDC006430 TaxID=3154299 RepID=UPI0033A85A11
MSGTRQARTAVARALSAACVVLLCLFAAGPAVTAAVAAETAAVERTGSGMPNEPGAPAERESDPAADPAARAAVRLAVRGLPGVRQLSRPVFHVEHAARAVRRAGSYGAVWPAPSAWTVRSVVLRC